MTARRRYEVAIVGGGLAGMTLAIMCERLNIDYILLEARDSLVEDRGTGIAIQPNALRILDQLGVAEKIEAETAALADWYMFDGKGDLMNANSHMRLYRENVGYPTVFAGRPQLCQILSGSITQKERIVTPCKVVSVTENDDEVILTTSGGDMYTADLVIGADGVRSTVRSFIDRVQAAHKPPRSSDDYLGVTFSCTHGMSYPTQGFVSGDRFVVYREKTSAMGFAAEDGSVFWFVVEACPNDSKKPLPLSQAPKFTTADADAMCNSISDVRIMPNATFGDLFANRAAYFRIPLEEGMAADWHTHRTVLVGDAAHKINPASGMGANQSWESSAVLINELMNARRQCGGDKITRDALHAAWVRYSENRKKVAGSWVRSTHVLTQSLLCFPGKPLAMAEKMRELTDEDLLGSSIERWADSPALEDVELTERGKFFAAAMDVAKAKKQKREEGAKRKKQRDGIVLGKL